MSVALFDLGQRLRAAAESRPVARSTYAPVLPPVNPVAVTISGSGDRTLLRATDGVRQFNATGEAALAALNQLNVSVSSDARTLIVADRDALAHLLELAHAVDPAGDYADSAAVIAWWSQRADHPGTGAVLDVVAACSARWVLGVPPAHERELAIWRRWLGVADPDPQGLLDLAGAVSAGTTLPGLDALAEEDRVSWDAFVARMTDPTSTWHWRRGDNRREAALGLASRCDAAELYESLRLGDPLVATRESFGGTVVSGIITALPSRSVVEITLDQLTCRLREQTAVEGFAGYPRDLPPALSGTPLIRGQVLATRVTSNEQLVVTIGDAILRSLSIKQHVTLRPRSIDPRQQRSGRQELHRRYAARRSWLSGGAAPSPRRRDVPLDVVISAAE
ncbi:MAG: hypothetical protein JOZ81_22175 [Chloroflexi bacterium]|nr:hypothetical protein [Chloroflexota bacterium]